MSPKEQRHTPWREGERGVYSVIDTAKGKGLKPYDSGSLRAIATAN